MAIDGSIFSEQATALRDVLAADPVMIAAAVAVTALCVMIVVRLRRRKAQDAAPDVEDSPISATPRKTRRSRPNDLIEDRFAALRLQTDELETLAPPPRHFRETKQRTANHNLRRR